MAHVDEKAFASEIQQTAPASPRVLEPHAHARRASHPESSTTKGPPAARPRRLRIATLRARHRLRRTQSFRAIQRDGSWVRGRTLAVGWVHTRGSDIRIGVRIRRVVATKAVVRNRAKRLVRESFRLMRTRLKPGHDILVIINRIGTQKLEAMNSEFAHLCQRADLLLPHA